MSSFTHQVYQLTGKIPQGKVTTYKEIARALNCKAYQAVGQALKHNPFAPKVPCHRVVKSDGTIGGFNGKLKGPSIKRKINLLKKEGIKFSGYKIKNSYQVFFRFPSV